MPTTYSAGSLVEYTGNTEMFAGQLFYEVTVLEGREKGKKKLIVRPPGFNDQGEVDVLWCTDASLAAPE